MSKKQFESQGTGRRAACVRSAFRSALPGQPPSEKVGEQQTLMRTKLRPKKGEKEGVPAKPVVRKKNRTARHEMYNHRSKTKTLLTKPTKKEESYRREVMRRTSPFLLGLGERGHM